MDLRLARVLGARGLVVRFVDVATPADGLFNQHRAEVRRAGLWCASLGARTEGSSGRIQPRPPTVTT